MGRCNRLSKYVSLAVALISKTEGADARADWRGRAFKRESYLTFTEEVRILPAAIAADEALTSTLRRA